MGLGGESAADRAASQSHDRESGQQENQSQNAVLAEGRDLDHRLPLRDEVDDRAGFGRAQALESVRRQAGSSPTIMAPGTAISTRYSRPTHSDAMSSTAPASPRPGASPQIV